MSNAKDAPAEFFSDERKNAYLSALVTERTSYEKKLEGAKASKHEADTAKFEQRIEQVDAELKRLGTTAQAQSKLAENR